jgi:uncharacterized protein
LPIFLGHDAGIATVVAFLKGLPKSQFCILALTEADLNRIAEILAQSANSRIDFVDFIIMRMMQEFATY